MAAVTALADADKVFVGLGKLLDNAPGFVLAAVIYKKHTAVLTDLSRGGKTLDFFKEHRRGDRENLLLIIAGNNYEKSWCHNKLL